MAKKSAFDRGIAYDSDQIRFRVDGAAREPTVLTHERAAPLLVTRPRYIKW